MAFEQRNHSIFGFLGLLGIPSLSDCSSLRIIVINYLWRAFFWRQLMSRSREAATFTEVKKDPSRLYAKVLYSAFSDLLGKEPPELVELRKKTPYPFLDKYNNLDCVV